MKRAHEDDAACVQEHQGHGDWCWSMVRLGAQAVTLALECDSDVVRHILQQYYSLWFQRRCSVYGSHWSHYGTHTLNLALGRDACLTVLRRIVCPSRHRLTISLLRYTLESEYMSPLQVQARKPKSQVIEKCIDLQCMILHSLHTPEQVSFICTVSLCDGAY